LFLILYHGCEGEGVEDGSAQKDLHPRRLKQFAMAMRSVCYRWQAIVNVMSDTEPFPWIARVGVTLYSPQELPREIITFLHHLNTSHDCDLVVQFDDRYFETDSTGSDISDLHIILVKLFIHSMDFISPFLKQVVALKLDTSRHEPFGHLFNLLSKEGELPRLGSICIRQPYAQNKKTLPEVQESYRHSTFYPLFPSKGRVEQRKLDLTHHFRLNTMLLSRPDWLLDMQLPATLSHLTIWDAWSGAADRNPILSILAAHSALCASLLTLQLDANSGLGGLLPTTEMTKVPGIVLLSNLHSLSISIEGRMEADGLLFHLQLPRLRDMKLYYHPENESNLSSGPDKKPVGESTITEGSSESRAPAPPRQFMESTAQMSSMESLTDVLISFPLSPYMSPNLGVTLGLLSRTPFKNLKLYCFRFGWEPALSQELQVEERFKRSLAGLKPVTMLLDMTSCIEAFSNYFVYMDLSKLLELQVVHVGELPTESDVQYLPHGSVRAPQLDELYIDGLPISILSRLFETLNAKVLQKLTIKLPHPEIPAGDVSRNGNMQGYPKPRRQRRPASKFTTVKYLSYEMSLEDLPKVSHLWDLTPNASSLTLHIYPEELPSWSQLSVLRQCLEPKNLVLPLPELNSFEGSFYNPSHLSSSSADLRTSIRNVFQNRLNDSTDLQVEIAEPVRSNLELAKIRFRVCLIHHGGNEATRIPKVDIDFEDIEKAEEPPPYAYSIPANPPEPKEYRRNRRAKGSGGRRSSGKASRGSTVHKAGTDRTRGKAG
jgi:hypothetical protein